MRKVGIGLLWTLGGAVLAAQGAVVRFDPTDTSAVPKWLSQTGVYSNIVARTPDTALKPFEVNAALWSDGAGKQRWIALPPGGRVPYVDTSDAFIYPDRTVFVKNFLLERVQGDTATRVLWETRLLVNRKNQGRDVWHGFSYRWNAEGTDARLVPAGGFDTIFAFYPKGLGKPQGYRKWHYPTRDECNLCHVPTNLDLPSHSRGILGFFPAQLKRPWAADPSRDQVVALFDAGVFSGTVPSASQLAKRWKGVHELLPAGRGSDARFRALDTMARAYLAANCSGCHGDRGIRHFPSVPEAMNFDFHDFRPRHEHGLLPVTDDKSLGEPGASTRAYYLEAVARAGLDTTAGSDWQPRFPPPSLGPPAFIYPGYPYASLALYRQFVRRAPWRDSVEARGSYGDGSPGGGWMFSVPWGTAPWRDSLAAHGVAVNAVIEYTRDGGSSGGQMPPLPASFIPDTVALRVLAEWAREYRTLYVVDSSRIITRVHSARATQPPPIVRGRIISWTASGKAPVLTTLRGQKIPLMRAGRGRWLIPSSLPQGVYVLSAGGSLQRVVLNGR